MTKRTRTLVLVALTVVAISNLSSGIWAMFAPRSFFDALASDYPPYNVHLIHDIGAFMFGLGVTAAVALFRRDGWIVALAGNAAAAVAHFGTHVVDREESWVGFDPFGLLLMAGLLVTALVKLLMDEGTEGTGAAKASQP